MKARLTIGMSLLYKLGVANVTISTNIYDYLLADSVDRYSDVVLPSAVAPLAFINLATSPLRWNSEDTRTVC